MADAQAAKGNARTLIYSRYVLTHGKYPHHHAYLVSFNGYVLYYIQDINPSLSFHVETVVSLSRKTPDDIIHVDLDLTDLPLTKAEAAATYTQIKEYVLEHTGLKVSSLYVSQVKRKLGLEVGESYNKPKSEDAKQPQCPPDKEAAIASAVIPISGASITSLKWSAGRGFAPAFPTGNGGRSA